MKRKLFYAVAILTAAALLTGCARFKKNTGENDASDIQYLSGMLLYGISEAPYGVGDILFKAQNPGTYRYMAYGADQEMPQITAGFNAKSWPEIADGQVISGTDCRNITVVCTDKNGIVERAAYFEYVPGVLYGQSNPDQYDDPVFYNAEQPNLEDPRAIALASHLFKTADASYYGRSYGYVIQGFLTKYSSAAGVFAGYYHTGIDFTTQEGRPFYAPIDGEIIYAGQSDDYHMIILYNAQHDISVLLLHGEDVSPAQVLYSAGGRVSAGTLLGYGGGAGKPAGDTQLHIEVRSGQATRYQNFSTTPEYTRMGNYDPLILSDMFQLTPYEANAFDAFTAVETTGYNAQGGAVAALVGNWLYYINVSDGSRIYRSRPDGSQASAITEAAAANLNHSDGWLYYSNLSDNGKLYKTACDGSESIKLSDINCQEYVLCAGDWVYFCNAASRNALCRIQKDGSEYSLLLNREIADPFYSKGSIYYTQNASIKAERICRYDTSTGENTQILDFRADIPFIADGMMGYRKYYGNKLGYAIPLGATTEDEAITIIDRAYNQVQQYNRLMIFANESDASSLYLKMLDGESSFQLSSDILCRNLTIEGNWLYYTTPLDTGETICRINLSTLQKQQLSGQTWQDIALNYDPAIDDLIHENMQNSTTPTPLPDGPWTPPPMPSASFITMPPQGDDPTAPPETEPPVPEQPTPEPTPPATEPTDPTDSPETDPPTDPPEVTDPPETEPPTDPPEATDPPETEPPTDPPEATDPLETNPPTAPSETETPATTPPETE